MRSATEYQRKYYRPEDHPYRIYEQMVEQLLDPENVLLDAGCGRSAPVLRKFAGKAGTLIGVDLEEPEEIAGVQYIQGDVGNINLPDNSVDVVISRAVLEHVQEPEKVFEEIGRVLKSRGHFVFLIPNLWDYASLLSLAIPNKLHPRLVKAVEGRDASDTFPAYYRVNTRQSISRFANKTGFEIEKFKYLGQYPSYLMFNPFLFLAGTLYDKTISKIKPLNFLSGWILADLRKI